MSYGLKGNFHHELNYHLGVEKLRERKRVLFLLFFFSFKKAYLADVRTHTHSRFINPTVLGIQNRPLPSLFVFDKAFKGPEMDMKRNYKERRREKKGETKRRGCIERIRRV